MGAKTSSHAGVASLSHEAQWSILRKDQSACKADLIFHSIQDIVEPSHFADERTLLFLLFVDVIWFPLCIDYLLQKCEGD